MNLNILIFGISYVKGMAGTARIKNFIDYLPDDCHYTISNLVIKHLGTKIDYPERGKYNNVEYEVLQYDLNNPLTFLNYIHSGKKFIKTHYSINSKNIFYVYGYPNLINIYLILFARRKKYKIVFDIVEDNRYILVYKSFISKIKIKSSIYIFKKIVNKAEGCIVISNHLQQYVMKITDIKTKVKLLPISVNIDNKETQNIINVYKHELKIFYGGSFGKKDGLEVLFDAFDLLVKKGYKIYLVLTGIGNNDLLESLLNNPKYSESINNINYLGYLDKESYHKVLKDCDIHCMTRINTPYSNAGFPFKLGEMLATGNPVIASKIGDVPVYLEDKISALLIEPENAIALVKAVEYLINNPSERIKIGQNGKIVARKYFDAKIISAEFYNFLKSL